MYTGGFYHNEKNHLKHKVEVTANSATAIVSGEQIKDRVANGTLADCVKKVTKTKNTTLLFLLWKSLSAGRKPLYIASSLRKIERMESNCSPIESFLLTKMADIL